MSCFCVIGFLHRSVECFVCLMVLKTSVYYNRGQMLLKALLAEFNSIIYDNFIATENKLPCISKESLKLLLIFKEKQLKRHYLISVFLVISIL